MKIISFDQATHKTGYSVWVDTTLEKYGTLTSSSADSSVRLKEMYALLYRFIDVERPDFVTVEGTQCQHNNYKTFGLLCQMQGELFAILNYFNIGFIVIPPMTWKSFHGIKNGKRVVQKAEAIQIVRTMGYIASEDESEAILQGMYALHVSQ